MGGIVYFVDFIDGIRVGTDKFIDKESGRICWEQLGWDDHLYLWLLDPKKFPVLYDIGKEPFYLHDEGYDDFFLEGEIHSISHFDGGCSLAMSACYEEDKWINIELFVSEKSSKRGYIKMARGPRQEDFGKPKPSALEIIRENHKRKYPASPS